MSSQGLTLLKNAWSHYVESNVLDVQHIRPEVANSWQRCRNLKVNPLEHSETCIDTGALRERLYAKQDLMKVARPFITNLYNFVSGSGFQVVLTDENGFLLEVMGDNEIVSRTKALHLCPGGDWSEAINGTNAIGTAIVERKPVQIFAWEHFCERHHFLTCSAAPIFDPEGSLIGVLDITGDYHAANAHTLGMVVAAVNAIENQLRLLKATHKLYTAYRYSNILLENMSDGLVSINNNGIITEINGRAGDIFGVNPAVLKGRHVSQLNRDTTVVQVLSECEDRQSKETIIEKLGKKIHTAASPLRDEGGQVIGTVAVFREINSRPQPARRLPAAPTCHCYTFDDIIGDSDAIAALKARAKLAAEGPSTVLIQGESGTGKELFAQAIHSASPRRNRPFVAINSAALPENLIESELFGHEEGSFTGSKKGGQPGKFELAAGGTIFLDEIGDMPVTLQTKLLRVMQERRVARIGSAVEREVDIRIIAATNKDLYSEVRRHTFREDLYYRLNVLVVRIPPLRERTEDIPVLTEHLAQKISARFCREGVHVTDAFMAKLQSYSWPGNIRELENTIERAMILAGENNILTPDLIEFPSSDGIDNTPVLEPPTPRLAQPVKSLSELEKESIIGALAVTQGNVLKASAQLGICRNTLYRKMKEYGISH